MTPVLPGIGSLGQGFDIFGRYDDSSLKAPLFAFNVGDDSGVEIDVPNGGKYLRPFNTMVNFANNPARGAALVFSSREEYVEHLEVKADVKANYRAFSGAFSFAFNVDKKQEQNYSYALYEYEKLLWSIKIVDPSDLSESVLNDPVFTGVPKTYDPGNAYLFYRFFHKYGTHFVSSVDVGARLNYCVTVAKSFSSDKTSIQAKLDAEIDAAFLSGSADVSANWKKVGQQWTESRRVRIDVLGGDNARLAALRPGYEQGYKDVFDTWVGTLKDNPGTINYRLSPIEELFSGDQIEQVRRAAVAYANSQLQVVSEHEDSVILLNGMRIDMETVGPKDQYMGSIIKIAVIDGDTLQPAFKRGYRIKNRDFTAVMKDISPYEKDDKYIVAIALGGEPGSNGWTSGYSGIQFPSGDFYGFLLGCGGGEAVSIWHDKYHHASADYTDHVTLAFIGSCGAQANSGMGVLGHNDGQRAPSPPRVEALAFLRPVGLGEGKIRFKPEPL